MGLFWKTKIYRPEDLRAGPFSIHTKTQIDKKQTHRKTERQTHRKTKTERQTQRKTKTDRQIVRKQKDKIKKTTEG